MRLKLERLVLIDKIFKIDFIKVAIQQIKVSLTGGESNFYKL